MKYRKKPVVIEAMRFTEEDARRVAAWAGAEVIKASQGRAVVALVIPTLEGKMWVRPDDWVIRGVAGEFYPCKPDIFEATYEPVVVPS